MSAEVIGPGTLTAGPWGAMLEVWTTTPGPSAARTRPVPLRSSTPVAYPATTAVQEDPVHPDLYLIVYRQQERELEHRLEHLRSQAARDGDRPRRAARPRPLALLATRRRHAIA
jgi:hypothetical protein